MSKKNEKDQYYTELTVAKKYSDIMKSLYSGRFVEPSAGTGSFSMNFDKIDSYDIDPKFDDCICADFLSSWVCDDNTIVIGNPPFGKSGNMAVNFINHCTNQKVIAIGFVLPRTFKKKKFQNRIDVNYHLVFEEDVPKNSFVLDGEKYDVPCVFQIWERRKQPRELFFVPENIWFELVKKDVADYSIRRVGGRAGMVLDGTNYSESTTYFVRDKIYGVRDRIVSLYPTLKDISSNTAGVRSIGIDEIVFELSK